MIETVDSAIRAGKKNFFDGIDKRKVNQYRSYLKHQELNCLDRVREQLDVRYHGAISISSEDDSAYEVEM
jgi:hypothetical protein